MVFPIGQSFQTRCIQNRDSTAPYFDPPFYMQNRDSTLCGNNENGNQPVFSPLFKRIQTHKRYENLKMIGNR
jgi:hypothetical protein